MSEHKWYPFDKSKGSRQKRPQEHKYVLVKLASSDETFPPGVGVGYLKNLAGDKQSPVFIVPGIHTGKAIGWCDCLPEGFTFPDDGWPNNQQTKGT